MTPPIRNSASRGAGNVVQPRPDLVGEARADQVVGDLAVEEPRAGVRLADDVGEQVVELEHLDPAVTHLGDELVVVPLGTVDPDHVVEQQLVARVRREPEVGQPGRAHQHSSQAARLGPHTDPGLQALGHQFTSDRHEALDEADHGRDRQRHDHADQDLLDRGEDQLRLSLRAHT